MSVLLFSVIVCFGWPLRTGAPPAAAILACLKSRVSQATGKTYRRDPRSPVETGGGGEVWWGSGVGESSHFVLRSVSGSLLWECTCPFLGRS